MQENVPSTVTDSGKEGERMELRNQGSEETGESESTLLPLDEKNALVQSESPGCLSAPELFGAGLVLSCFSPTFYYRAAHRRVAWAVVFFFAFTLAVAGLQTLGLIRGLIQVRVEIQRAFDSGDFPEITISGGVAEVSGPQPFVLLDEDRTLLVLDTTGTYTEIDRTRYESGMLLTRTTVVFLTEGDYQEIPLRDLHALLKADPILISGETVPTYWTVFSVIITLIAFLGLAIWHTLVRLAYLALIALAFWGITVLIRPGTGFGPVLTTGLYTVVPALYLRFMISQLDFGFPCLSTLILLIFWVFGLVSALYPRDRDLASWVFALRPRRKWRVLIALPLLTDFALEVVFNWQAWYVTWPLAVLTFGTLIGVSLPAIMRTSHPVGKPIEEPATEKPEQVHGPIQTVPTTVVGGVVQRIVETLTGQSGLAYRLAAIVLFLGVLLNIADALVAGDTIAMRITPIVIDFSLAIGLLQLRSGARTWALVRAVLGAILWPIFAFVSNDPITGILMSVMQWGYCGALILLLTGQGKTGRLVLALGIFVVFTLVPSVLMLLLIALASLVGM